MGASLTAAEREAARAADRRDRALRSAGAGWRTRGVVHTPPELARFVARSVDRVLSRGLGCPAGLADRRVWLVDPACGPGAFLAAALAVARRRRSVPGRVLGLDVDPDAVRSAEAIVGPAMARAGWPARLRCADTLASLSPFGEAPDDDARVVVVGNPPWAGRTANRDAALVGALLEDFRRDPDGRRLAERKIGVLSDDYVRFFRWAAEVARRSPGGAAVGLVTNASFVDGPVHRGMRGALARWFDGIDVIDLGGSALVARDGSADDNVFGVRPGVAVTIAWRSTPEDGAARVRYVALRGSRADKLERLGRLGARSFAPVACAPPRFDFRPAGSPLPSAFGRFLSLADAMPFHREGVQTNRDAIAVDADRGRLVERLRAFARGERREDLRAAWTPSGHYDPDRARRAVARALERDPDGAFGELVRPIAYRPFDDRWFCPVPRLCHRPRPALLRALGPGSPALLTVRKDRGQRPWTHFGVARHVPDNCWLSTRSSCRTRAFPLWTPEGEPNLAPEVAIGWSDRLGLPIDPLSFVEYAIAFLASRRYRAEFDEALHHDYPRLPEPPDAESFRRVRDAGRAIVRAFDAPASGEEVEVGHVRVTCTALARAVRASDAPVSALLSLALD